MGELLHSSYSFLLCGGSWAREEGLIKLNVLLPTLRHSGDDWIDLLRTFLLSFYLSF